MNDEGERQNIAGSQVDTCLLKGNVQRSGSDE